MRRVETESSSSGDPMWRFELGGGSRRERRALREGSWSMKEVTRWVPFSTRRRKERRRRERRRKVKKLEKKEEKACLKRWEVDRSRRR